MLGYGIPNFATAYNLANPTTPLASSPAATLAQLQVYPNPSHDEDLLLSLPADLRGVALHVRFYDARGAMVAEQQLSGSNAPTATLHPGALRPGVYTCTVQAASAATRALRFVRL